MTRLACVTAAFLLACSSSEGPASSGSSSAGSGGSSVVASGGAGGVTTTTGGSGTSGNTAVAGSAMAGTTGGGASGTGSSGGGGVDSGGAGSGGSAGASGGSASAGAAGSGGNSGTFSLTSSELTSGSMFSATNTCAGKGSSPALTWTAGPPGTKSYAITFFDTTLVEQGNANGYHWVIWDIPATTLALPAALPAGASLSTPVMAKQSSPANPFDNYPANAYFGPCPNAVGQTNNTDTYAFTLYALGVETLTGNLSGVKNVDAAIQAATPLATAKLTGTSSAKPD